MRLLQRGFGTWFVVEINGLVRRRVSAFAGKGPEEAKEFGVLVVWWYP